MNDKFKINCEYCNTAFKTKSALNHHKNKAKYCLIIQKKIDETPNEFKCNRCSKILSSKQYLKVHEEKCEGLKEDLSLNLDFQEEECNSTIATEKKIFKCEYCGKILSRKQSLLNHLNCCYKKKDKELVELKERTDRELIEKDKIIVKVNTQLENYKEQLEKQEENYKNLQDKLDKIANKAIDRPTTSFNNTTNNNLNITTSMDFDNMETLKDAIDTKLNANHIVDGQRGLAQFLVDAILKDSEGNLKYKCTDSSRGIFKFLNSQGEINKDVDAKKLISYIVSCGIKGKSVEIANRWYRDEDGVIDMMKYEIMNEPQQHILKIEDDSSSFRRELASMTIAN